MKRGTYISNIYKLLHNSGISPKNERILFVKTYMLPQGHLNIYFLPYCTLWPWYTDLKNHIGHPLLMTNLHVKWGMVIFDQFLIRNCLLLTYWSKNNSGHLLLMINLFAKYDNCWWNDFHVINWKTFVYRQKDKMTWAK